MHSHKTNLNSNQTHLLLLLYKFRYITADLIAKHRGVLKWSVNSALRILLEKKLISRRYDKSYNLKGKSASYFLARDGIKVLQANPQLNRAGLQVRHKDKLLSDGFIDHHLNVFQSYLQIRSLYPEKFQIYTKYELPTDDRYIDPKSDLYLKPKASNSTHTAYFLDIFDTSPFFVIKQRIQAYIEHYDSGKWGKTTYPTVLIVCPSAGIEKRILDYLAPRLEDVSFLVTTLNALLKNDVTAIWSNPDDLKELLSL